MSAALLLALALFVPGPDDPVCEPGQSPAVDRCAQGQLPDEMVGREVGEPPVDEPPPAPAEVVQSPAATTLARTGPVELFYVLAGLGLVATGGVLVRVVRR